MMARSLLKTKICTFWELGRCKRKVCQFAHGVAELHQVPDFTKTAMCRNVRSPGGCKDPGCKYAHSQDELRIIDKQLQRMTYSSWDAMGQVQPSHSFNDYTPGTDTCSTWSTLPDLDAFEHGLGSSYLGLGDQQPLRSVQQAVPGFGSQHALAMQWNPNCFADVPSSPSRMDMLTEGKQFRPGFYKQVAIPVLVAPMASTPPHALLGLSGQRYQSPCDMQDVLAIVHAMQKQLKDMEVRILKAAMPDNYDD